MSQFLFGVRVFLVFFYTDTPLTYRSSQGSQGSQGTKSLVDDLQ
jgi:hypothetical protein